MPHRLAQRLEALAGHGRDRVHRDRLFAKAPFETGQSPWVIHRIDLVGGDELGLVRERRMKCFNPRNSVRSQFVADYYLVTVLAVIFFQLAVLFRLFTRDLPAWMDNACHHENRADNLASLRRASVQPS